MDLKRLDHPLVLASLFFPRVDRPFTSRLENASDGTIRITDGIVLGYRLYVHAAAEPVILYFHGNGEIASDHDAFAHHFQRAGASLLVVDYRGYGWSTGSPTVSTLLSDVDPVVQAVPGILREAGLSDRRLYVMGRSLGSGPALHAAHEYPDRFKGIIIESGFSRAMNLLSRLGLPRFITDMLPDPVGNNRKIAEISLPLLVIHGENDTLLPLMHGRELHDLSPALFKRLLVIPQAGHNDLLYLGLGPYFDAIAEFLKATV